MLCNIFVKYTFQGNNFSICVKNTFLTIKPKNILFSCITFIMNGNYFDRNGQGSNWQEIE